MGCVSEGRVLPVSFKDFRLLKSRPLHGLTFVWCVNDNKDKHDCKLFKPKLCNAWKVNGPKIRVFCNTRFSMKPVCIHR